MVYIHAWQDYQEAAEALYAQSPNNTRYCIKWKSSEGQLILKITDDVSCLKFKTHSSIFLNRFEALNLSLMTKMQNQQPVAVPSVDAVMTLAGPVESAKTEPVVAVDTAAGTKVTPAASGAGGIKKKKPKKKK